MPLPRSQSLIDVLKNAGEEARTFKLEEINTACLLIALARQDTDTGKQLRDLQFNVEALRSETLRIVGEGDNTRSTHLPFSRRALVIIDHRVDQVARVLGSWVATDEHLARALLGEYAGTASFVIDVSLPIAI